MGIFIYSGYQKVTNKLDLWSNEEDVNLQWAKDFMPRNRFMVILRDLHLADNCQIDKNDPYYKIRSYIGYLNNSFLEGLPLDQNLSIDEVMIPYFGRHGTKQFIWGKPIRYGFKLWGLASIFGVEGFNWTVKTSVMTDCIVGHMSSKLISTATKSANLELTLAVLSVRLI